VSTPGGGSTRNVPLLVASAAVLVAAVVAIAVGVNHAGVSGTPTAQPTASTSASASPSSTPAATPTPSFIPYADCSTKTFGPVLQPLNPPSNVHTYPAAPAHTIDDTKLYLVTIATAKGNIVLCLQPELAPNSVNVFVTLTRNHFFDGIPFHRVVTGFVIQGGDPNCIGHVPSPPATPSSTCGQGGAGFSFNDESPRQAYTLGCVALANSEPRNPNSNGSQFFICTADDTTLAQNGHYNLLGKVQTGMNVALQIVQGDLMQTVTAQESQ
jgi:cyclophilin family peptidyl-prolyl cis-trans isomerase